MKKKWIVLKIGIVVAVIAMVVFVVMSYRKNQIQRVELQVVYLDNDTLIRVNDLQKVLDETYGQLQGTQAKDINSSEIENLLKQNPFLKTVDVYISIRGNLQIKAVQRKPIVRVFTSVRTSFYIDEEGVIFPTSTIGSSHVLVANGNIQTPLNYKYASIEMLRKDSLQNKSQLIQIFDLAKFIYNNPFLRAQMDQIYLTENNEIELVPKVGQQIILLGNTENLQEKFKKLVALYQEGFANLGWETYSRINLKYKDQVVCTKK